MNSLYLLISLALWVISIVAFWKVFEKAGHAGWLSIIPFVNVFVLFEIAGFNGWMFLLMFIPIVNLILAIVLSLKIAEAFGRSAVFGIFGLFIFSFIGYLILGFGEDTYKGGAKPTPVAA